MRYGINAEHGAGAKSKPSIHISYCYFFELECFFVYSMLRRNKAI